MKTTLLALSMLFSVAAVAGPEDHMNDSCYSAKSTLANLPTSYCFEDVDLDLRNNVLSFQGYASNVPSSLKIVNVFKRNEDTTAFVAKVTVLNIWETGCGEGQFAELFVSGNADHEGKVDPKALSFSVNYSLRADTCHSSPSTGAIEYKLSK